jgi:HEAT repeat protein
VNRFLCLVAALFFHFASTAGLCAPQVTTRDTPVELVKDVAKSKDADLGRANSPWMKNVGSLDVGSLVDALRGTADAAMLNEIIYALGDKGAPAVGPLVDALKGTTDRDLSATIAFALGHIGAPAAPAVGALVDALTGTTADELRIAIAFALGRIGAPAAPAVGPLVDALKGTIDDNLRGAIASALASIGAPAAPAVAALVDTLKDIKDGGTRVKVFWALERIGPPAAPAVGSLVDALKDTTDHRMRRAIVSALGGIGAPAAPAVGPLVDALKNAADDDLRIAIASALGRIGAPAAPAVGPLVDALKGTTNDNLRGAIASTLGSIGAPAAPAVGALVDALVNTKHDPTRMVIASGLGAIGAPAVDALGDSLRNTTSEDIRGAIAFALGDIGAPAAPAVGPLVDALNGTTDDNTRYYIALALGNIGEPAAPAVAALVDALNNTVDDTRRMIVFALGNIGAPAAPAVGPLIDALKTATDVGPVIALGKIGAPAVGPLVDALKGTTDDGVRSAIASALGSIGAPAAPAVGPLVDALKGTTNDDLRYEIARALGGIGAPAAPAVGALVDALTGTTADELRIAIAYALGSIGAPAAPAVGPLVDALKGTIDDNLRDAIASALGMIASSVQALMRQNKFSVDSHLYEELQLALIGLKETGQDDRHVANLIYFLSLQKPTAYGRIVNWTAEHPISTGLVLFAPFWFGGWFVVFAARPLAFYRAAWWAKERDALSLGPLKISVPFHWFVLGWLRHHPRVLDAWVHRHRSTARSRFLAKPTVQHREVHISVPVNLAGMVYPELTPSSFRASAFGREPGALLIWGEGGAGKTSLACQIARWCLSDKAEEWPCRHPMLPVLLEHELNPKVDKGRDELFEAIGRHIEDVLALDRRPNDDLLDALLRRRRLLVIVDHLSEMSEATRERIRPDAPDFAPKALIVTSRRRETLGGVIITELQPMRVEAERLSEFMSAYLRRSGVRDLFPDTEFFSACERLARLVGDRSATVLLVRLFADQLIEAKRAADARKLPANIPELMLAYVSLVNGAVPEKERTADPEVQQDAQKVARACLAETFRPGDAGLPAVLGALGEDAGARLAYLRERLNLVDVVGVRKDRVRFQLDPLAEYLAALEIIGRLGTDRRGWARFLANLAKAASAREFLLVLRDCIRVSRTPLFPDALTEVDKLAESASIDASAGSGERPLVSNSIVSTKAGLPLNAIRPITS